MAPWIHWGATSMDNNVKNNENDNKKIGAKSNNDNINNNKTLHRVDFALPADHWVKIKESQKGD